MNHTPDDLINEQMEGESTPPTPTEVPTPEPSDPLTEALAQVDSLRDQLLRKVAEFENYRRRTQEEQRLLVQTGMEILMKDLLPVLDDFDRSLQAARDHEDSAAFRSGVEVIAKKLVSILEQRGMKKMEVLGAPFDVTYHEALMQMPSPEAPAGSILQEVESGYLCHDRVLRHARVIVAAGTEESA